MVFPRRPTYCRELKTPDFLVEPQTRYLRGWRKAMQCGTLPAPIPLIPKPASTLRNLAKLSSRTQYTPESPQIEC
ncbi:hypothetical protein CC2G_012847 [Coprinopsis cinerea AmutBmut pab1-1]|nr:hypothetical protein CC2G_012847 [Coprinopsis cinerea AmutBmut pab1-1]